jgi:hypothetical protein
MSNTTNEPSREPICKPTNDQKKSEPTTSYSHIIRDKSTPTFQLVVAFDSNNNALSFNDKSSSKFHLVVASVANECSKGSSKKTAQWTMNNSRQSRSFIDDVSFDSWQCPREIDEVNFQQVGNSASTQLVGFCYDKKKQGELETALPLNLWASAMIKNQSKLETILPLNSWDPVTIKHQSEQDALLPLNMIPPFS